MFSALVLSTVVIFVAELGDKSQLMAMTFAAYAAPEAWRTPVAVIAVAAGAWFLRAVHKLYAGTRRGEPIAPLRVFLQSNEYLAVVFCGLAVDSVIHLPTVLSTF